MMKGLKELIAGKLKAGQVMDEGKSDVLKSLADEMKGMADKESLKKITVASDSSEGLKEGVEKAEEMLEAKEMPEEMEDEEMSMDEIEEALQMLQAKKQKMME